LHGDITGWEVECSIGPLLRRRGTSVARGWLFFGGGVLITFEDQITTTPVVFDAFPSFAGGELLFIKS